MLLKVIFLDIDGVLNIHWKKKWDPICVNNLNQILILTGSQIVITSTWKHSYNIQQLQEIFIKQGINGEIIDATPNIGDRGAEILSWISTHKPDKWVVIDDKCIEIENYIDHSHFFKVDQNTGLRDNDIKVKIILSLADQNILNSLGM